MEDNHRPIYLMQLLKDNSLILYFEDNTHSCITPDIMKEIVREYINNELPFPDEEEC